jgi:Fe-S oxidoreductase/nitrate reductase gamma subunit
MPTRQIYWNIEKPYFLYIFFLITLVIFIYGVGKKIEGWRTGQAENRFDQPLVRLKGVLSYAIGHKRILAEPLPGLFHLCIFWGFALLLFATIIVGLQADFNLPVFQGSLYLFIKLTGNFFGLLTLAGVLLAAWRRYVFRPQQVENHPEDAVILILIFFLLISGFLLEGLRMAARPDPWATWTIVGPWLSKILAEVDVSTLLVLHRFVWWFHLTFAMVFIGYFPYSKLFHIILGPLSIYFRKLGPVGIPDPINFEDETLEKFGKSQLNEFSWKTLFDLDACVRCGRCARNCPAFLSGKHLNPKLVIQNMRSQLKRGGNVSAHSGRAESPDLIGPVISETDLWSCTTCRACEAACPIFIEHVDKLIDLRRYLVLTESQFPPEAKTAFRNLENNGNPWGIGWHTRGDFLRELDVLTLEQKPDAEILYWVGCAGAFDARNQKVAKALTTLLQAAAVNFAVLGNLEKCCGDSARKLGNEYLFYSLATENIGILHAYNIKKIITSCPHCYHMLKNEYPQLGGKFEVLHYTEFLVELLHSGKLKITKDGSQKVVYHDSCYLGRYNGIFSQPRQLLTAMGYTLQEMPRSKERSFCCGAGGGQMWLEEKKGERINVLRTNEALALAPDLIATACPYCLTMLQDGLSSQKSGAGIQLLDLAEMLVHSVDQPIPMNIEKAEH